MVKIIELKEMTDLQLENLISDLDKELFEMKNELAMAHKVEKPHLFCEKRRTKARALTLLSQRKASSK